MPVMSYSKRFNKGLLHNTQSPAQCYITIYMGEEFARERTHVYVWLSPFPAHPRLSQHC